ncbi:hypothetical protein DB30_05961 [Enhygromyxa salina]|uniref:Uncharacterized protein n=1 Tax=Enhygromyxa salina TaxID=215803 RepID=A0A0C2DH95_9BACT|nr:hypothetical protein DB30_05961 [Enhygromyxa salina]
MVRQSHHPLVSEVLARLAPQTVEHVDLCMDIASVSGCGVRRADRAARTTREGPSGHGGLKTRICVVMDRYPRGRAVASVAHSQRPLIVPGETLTGLLCAFRRSRRRLRARDRAVLGQPLLHSSGPRPRLLASTGFAGVPRASPAHAWLRWRAGCHRRLLGRRDATPLGCSRATAPGSTLCSGSAVAAPARPLERPPQASSATTATSIVGPQDAPRSRERSRRLVRRKAHRRPVRVAPGTIRGRCECTTEATARPRRQRSMTTQISALSPPCPERPSRVFCARCPISTSTPADPKTSTTTRAASVAHSKRPPRGQGDPCLFGCAPLRVRKLDSDTPNLRCQGR